MSEETVSAPTAEERPAPKMADDPLTGGIRTGIVDEWIADGKPQDTLVNWLYSRLVRARFSLLAAERQLAEIAGTLYITRFDEDGPDAIQWEVPAEPEPLYFDTLAEAVKQMKEMFYKDIEETKAAAEREKQELRRVLRELVIQTRDDGTPEFDKALAEAEALLKEGK